VKSENCQNAPVLLFVSNREFGSTIFFYYFWALLNSEKSFVSIQILKCKGWSYAKAVCFLKEQGLLHQQVEHMEIKLSVTTGPSSEHTHILASKCCL